MLAIKSFTSSNFPWATLILLTAINMLRPLFSLTGLFDSLRPAGSIVVTGAIASIWIGIAVVTRLKYPILVMAMAGALYAVLSILMAVFIQLVLPGPDGEAEAPLPVLLSAGLTSSLMTNTLWGGFLGLMAFGLQVITKRQ
jgi:hypothetical protein